MVLTGRNGSFTISLDFELYWGVRDKRSIEVYRENLLGVWEAVPGMLALFEKYGIHATWAAVGFLFLEDEKAFEENLPAQLPLYKNHNLSPYHYVDVLEKERFEDETFCKMHFAKPLIERIQNTPHQEIATHTYSHYYTREPNISQDAFEADLHQAVKVAQQSGVTVDSLVFPRNQIDEGSVTRLPKAGICIFRGNPSHWAYKEGEVAKTFLQRVYRFADIYLNLSGAHLTLPKKMNGLVELQSSLFFRAYSKKFSFLESLKLRRVKHAMTKAAKEGKNFHLWWHPHNFGVNREENLENLEEVLQHFAALQAQYGMVSLNMRELGSYDAE